MSVTTKDCRFGRNRASSGSPQIWHERRTVNCISYMELPSTNRARTRFGRNRASYGQSSHKCHNIDIDNTHAYRTEFPSTNRARTPQTGHFWLAANMTINWNPWKTHSTVNCTYHMDLPSTNRRFRSDSNIIGPQPGLLHTAYCTNIMTTLKSTKHTKVQQCITIIKYFLQRQREPTRFGRNRASCGLSTRPESGQLWLIAQMAQYWHRQHTCMHIVQNMNSVPARF